RSGPGLHGTGGIPAAGCSPRAAAPHAHRTTADSAAAWVCESGPREVPRVRLLPRRSACTPVFDAPRQAHARELPRRIRRKEVAVRGPEAAARRRAAFASQDGLGAQERAGVVADRTRSGGGPRV